MEGKRRYLAFLAFLSFLGFLGFKNPLFFFFLFFLFFLFYLAPRQKTGSAHNSGEIRPDLIESQKKEKMEHLQKIKDFMQGKDKVSNDDIEKLLGVSDSTAQRYSAELTKNGTIKKQGSEGHVFYTK